MIRRVAPLAVMLVSCTLLNDVDRVEPPVPTEVCDNGIDDDGDAKTDCADSGCALVHRCFEQLGFARDPSCGAVRRDRRVAFLYNPEGNAINEDVWEVGGPFGHSPQTVDRDPLDPFQEIDLLPVPAPGFNFMKTKRTFSLGARHPFFADIIVNFADARLGSLLRICLVPRQEQPDPLCLNAAVELTIDRLQGHVISCAYHGRPVASQPAEYVPGYPLVHRLEIDPEARVMRAKFDDQTLCEIPNIAVLEPDLQLQISGFRRQDGPPIYVGLVQVEVRPPIPTAEELEARTTCAGVGESILAPEDCILDDLVELGISASNEAELVRTDDRFHLFFRAGNALLHAESLTANSGWYLAPKSSSGPDLYLTAVVYRSDVDRFEAWSSSSEARNYVTARASANEWFATKPLTLDGASGEWSPEAVIEREGEYLGFWSEVRPDGRCWLREALSPDGVAWTSLPYPILEPTPGEWDAESVGCALRSTMRGIRLSGVAVARRDSLYVMAYLGDRFPASAAIGIATSEDGLVWKRHRISPLIEGRYIPFDNDGFSDLALVIEDWGLRVWYVGHGRDPEGDLFLECAYDSSLTDNLSNVGYAELHFVLPN